jgi:hypothetical protein
MGKIYYHLYPQIWEPLNLWAAYKQAARGKRSLVPTVSVGMHPERSAFANAPAFPIANPRVGMLGGQGWDGCLRPRGF